MTTGRADLAASLLPWPSGAVEIDGHALRYLDEGTGPAVVCVHGNPTWSLYYRRVVAGLADAYRVIVPDHLGMGRSDAPDADATYTLDRRVADLGALMDALEVGREAPATLVVHDWGGAIGLAWATANPGRVGRLVVLNTAAFPLPADRRLPWLLRVARAPVIGDLLLRRANAFVHGTARLGARRGLPAEVRRAYAAPYDRPATRRAVAAFVRDIPLAPGDPAWSTVARVGRDLAAWTDVPALVVWGDRDPVFDTGYLEEWRRRLPQARVVVARGAGHLVLEDAPETVGEIRGFLDGTVPRSPGDGTRSEDRT